MDPNGFMLDVCHYLGINSVLTKQIIKLYMINHVGIDESRGTVLLRSGLSYIPDGFTVVALLTLNRAMGAIDTEYGTYVFRSMDCGSKLEILQARLDALTNIVGSNCEFINEVLSHHVENNTHPNDERYAHARIEAEKFYKSKEFSKIIQYENRYKDTILCYHREKSTYNESSYYNGPNGRKLMMYRKDYPFNLRGYKTD